MMTPKFRTGLAATAIVFLLTASLLPENAGATSMSEIEKDQNLADTMMYGALALAAVALIILIVRPNAESEILGNDPEKAEDQVSWNKGHSESWGLGHSAGRTAAMAEIDSGYPQTRGVSASAVGGIGRDGAMVGLRLGF